MGRGERGRLDGSGMGGEGGKSVRADDGGMGGEVGAQGGSGGMLKRAGNGDCCLILTMEDDSLASTSGESVLE